MAYGSVSCSRGWCLALALTVTGGCANTEIGGEAPPAGAFYFPIAVTALPAEAVGSGQGMALVSNANLDRRFASGWLSLIDVAGLLGAARPADAVVQQISVPSIGGPIALAVDPDPSHTLAAGGRWLAFMGHRGTRRLSIIEIRLEDGAVRLSCGDPAATAGLDALERRTDCDRRHLYALDDATNIAGFDATLNSDDFRDPYAVSTSVDPVTGQGRLAVSFLSHTSNDTNWLLLFHINNDAADSEPFLVPERAVALGQAGVGSIAFRPQSPSCQTSTPEAECSTTYIAASSRYYGSASEYSSVFAVTIGADDSVRQTTHRIPADIDSTEAGSIVFDPAGARAYATNNGSDSLIALDTSLTSQAVVSGVELSYVVEPSYRVIQALPLTGLPSEIVYFSRNSHDFVATTAFTGDHVDILAVTGGALVPVAQVRGTQANNVGSRPFAIATLPVGDDDLLLVGTLYDHGITAIRVPGNDAAAASVVARVRSTELGEVSVQ